ncbi:MAG: hypothetical protein Q9167_002834 [Letrouitia subvulpina]
MKLTGLALGAAACLSYPATAQAQGQAAFAIGNASLLLDKANAGFKPKVPCATIARFFNIFESEVLRLNGFLQEFACSSSTRVQEFTQQRASAIRQALNSQIPRVDQLAVLFAENNACNNPQSQKQLDEFAGNATVIENSDRKTAQDLTVVGGLLDCLRRNSGSG